jgi:Kef-type K+ transport system membrane component KefB/nucleotide-binding universal stress UspA family protein
MLERLQEPVAFFLLIMTIVLITPLLSERVRLPGIVGIILGGMLIGPHGLGLLADGDRIQFLSTIGLVYLMFSAGLEVDIHQFIRVRGRALIFGLLTFTFPQLFGMGLGWLLGLDWLGMILLGSAFASHTLIAFPLLTRLGVTRNEAVAVTVGATVMTDIGAFIILAVVLGARSGQLEIGYFIQLFILLIVFTLLVIFGLPRLGKFFFQRFNGRAVEFQFVLVVLFVAALGAELIGVHEVVGAFLAGLAINATLPRHSPVSGHVLFMGESFFIPVFLLYSGMITDPFSFIKSPQTVLVALGVTFVAYVSKFVAAWITGRIFGYSRSEFWTAYGLSHAQAAVTIPTLVIGLRIGLFDATLFNAAILMILLTSITSPMLVQRFAPGLRQAQDEDETTPPLFARILVPITNAQTQEHLIALSSLLAHAGGGKVMALNVVQNSGGQVIGLPHQKELLGRVPEILNDPETEVELIPRLANSFAQGILHTALERNASLILMGWRGKRTLQQSILGTVLDEVVWGSDTPVMVGKLSRPLNGMRRVTLILPPRVLSPVVMRRVLEANFTLAKALNVPLIILADSSYLESIHRMIAATESDQPCTVEELKGPLKPTMLEQASASDLIVVPGFGSRQRFLSSVGDLPERLAASFDGNLLILHFDR